MKSKARFLARALLASLLTLLSACGTMDERGTLGPTADLVVESLSDPGQDQADARRAVTPDLVAAIPTSLAFFEAVDPDFGVAGLLAHTIVSDPGRWSTLGNEAAFLLKGGLPIRTHGLGFGLAHANVDQTLAALRSGNARSVVREMRFLDGTNQEIIRRFTCEFTPEGRETITVFFETHETMTFTERCSDGATRFENRYWRGRDGTLWRSETWLSPQMGMLRLERISVKTPF